MENMILTESSIFYLGIVRKWTKFISVVMFIMVGMMVLAGIFTGFAMNLVNSMAIQSPMPFPWILFSVFYILMALVYFFPVLYLYRFSQYLGNALSMRSTDELTTALMFLKKHYHFIGVLIIIMIVMMVLFFFIAIIAGIAGLLPGSGGNTFM